MTTNYEEPRALPRILVFGKARNARIDFAHYLDVEPDQQVANLESRQSLSGRVHTLKKRVTAALSVKIGGLELEEARRVHQMFLNFAAAGLAFEMVRDRSKGHHLTGDDTRDVATGWRAFVGDNTASIDPLGGLPGLAGLGLFPGLPYNFSRGEMVKNGDIVDGSPLAVPTNWSVETASTCIAFKVEYLGGFDASRTKTMEVVSIQALRPGTKTVVVAFDLGSYGGSPVAYDTPPNSSYAVSFMARVDMHPTRLSALNGGGNELLNVSLRASDLSSSVRDDDQDVQLNTYWTRHFLKFTPGETSSEATGHIVFELSDNIAGHTVYLADVRMGGAEYWGGPAPYSSSRTGATGIPTQGHMAHLNRLLYGNQIPAWEDSEAFAVTFACWYVPFWSSAAGSRGPEFGIRSGGNDKLDFQEDASVLAITISAGQYTAAELAAAITALMNDAASLNTYLCSYSTSTNKFTIARASGTDTISLLWDSGANAAYSVASTIGFDDSADDTGATSYAADTADTGYLTLCQTIDTTIPWNKSGLWVYMTSQKIVAEFLLDDGTVQTLSSSKTTTAGEAVHVLASFTEDGDAKLVVNGVAVATATGTTKKLASIGKFVLVGSHLSNYGACCGSISSWKLDPIWVGDSLERLSDYYHASDMVEQLQNSWRVKLDRKGVGPLVMDNRDNAYAIDCRGIEDTTFTG